MKRRPFTDADDGRCENQGRTAAYNGHPYGANPYGLRGCARARLAWSRGHNAARVERAIGESKAAAE